METQLEQPQPAAEMAPKSVDEVVAALRGFGVEDYAETLIIEAGGRTVKLKLSNIPSEAEMLSLLAVEGTKGYLWVQKVKCEILSRAISWIDGVSIRDLTDKQRMVVDPTDSKRPKRDIQVVLRNIILGWGQEIMNVLWKVECVHSQSIEDRLVKSFPDSAIMTEVERRFMENAIRDIDAANKKLITEQVEEMAQAQAAEAPAEEPQQE